MVLNNYDDKSSFRTTYNKDLNHNDSEVIEFSNGRKTTVGDLRNLYSKYGGTRRKMVIFYDDMIQYTSLGLLDLLFEKHDIESEVPVKEFFEREIPADMFVKSICSVWGIDEDEIKYVYKRYYAEILRRSPFTRNADAFLRMRSFLTSQVFVFKYSCLGLNDVLEEISEKYRHATNDRVSSEAMIINDVDTNSFYKELFEKHDDIDIIAIPEANKMLDEYSRREDKRLTNPNIITTENHHFISKDQMALFYLADWCGPSGYVVQFVKEG